MGELVNEAPGTGVTSGSSITVTTGILSVGNILLACIGSSPSTGTTARTVSSIAQTGITWNGAATGKFNNGKYGIEIWLGTVGSAASTSCLITMSNAVSGLTANVSQWSGYTTTLDGAVVTGSGSTNNPTLSITTGNPSHDLVFSSYVWPGGTGVTLAGNAGFALTLTNAGAVLGVDESYWPDINNSTLSPNFNISSSQTWAGVAFALKGANPFPPFIEPRLQVLTPLLVQ